MHYQLFFFDEVLADIQDAKTWYQEQQDGLEQLFAAAIEQCIENLLLTPFAYGIRYKNIRMAHPKRFPYNIHFYIDTPRNAVIITAIIHSKRNPKAGISRV